MSDDDINNFIPSLLNPRAVRRNTGDITLTQNTIVSRCSLSLKRNGGFNSSQPRNKLLIQNKENTPIPTLKTQTKKKTIEELGNSTGLSAIEDLVDVFTRKENALSTSSSPFSFKAKKPLLVNKSHNITKLPKAEEKDNSIISILSASSDTELYSNPSETCKHTCQERISKSDKPVVTLNIGFKNCKNVDITTTNSNIKRIYVSHKNDDLIVDCDIVENSQVSCLDSTPEKKVLKDSGFVDENMNPQSPKRSGVAVNLQIKKRKICSSQTRLNSASTIEDVTDNSKILILNTDAIEKVSHVIVQPPNYKLVKRQISQNSKFTPRKSASKSRAKNVIKLHCDTSRQKSITDYFKSDPNASSSTIVLEDLVNNGHVCDVKPRGDDTQAMNKGFVDSSILKSDQFIRLGSRALNGSPFSRQRISTSAKQDLSPKRQNLRTVISEAQHGCAATVSKQHSPVRSLTRHSKLETIQVPIASSKAVKAHFKNVPLHKIVAGTHFAVDAFCYGDIPNVKHYFLTHFHSDHYAGLKKSFSKQLYCSRITADLCVSRLGVDPKVIHVIKLDETVHVDGIEIMPIDANHCPGAVMLIFTLPNQKTILHTGDFRASPVMESYPIFWNMDVHTIYLDTTYCNPRYDFPTQDQSLDMALYLLRQKKMALEKAGKKFSSVLIVCGTYTIGKEKFFMGMARRVGCNVWACPEKDRVLQSVEGRSFSHAPKHSCQLHVVPMRDLTVEKLNTYLESLQGAFTEVMAFKPSGWENGKNSTIEQNNIAIHGIPYSEHSSFSEMIRFVKFLKPKQVVPTVDISGGVKAVQKYFPCPLVQQDDASSQPRVTDYFSIQSRQPRAAVT